MILSQQVGRLLRDHPALPASFFLNARARDQKWKCMERYFISAIRSKGVRLEVRLLHTPSAKATTFFNSAESDGAMAEREIPVVTHRLRGGDSDVSVRLQFTAVYMPHAAQHTPYE